MTDPWGVVGPGFPDTVVTVFQAGDTIINSGGLFIYGGAPGPTTLILSIASSTTTKDPFGTPVNPSGLTIFGPGGQNIFLGLGSSSGTSVLQFLTGAAIEQLSGGVVSAISGAGAAEFLELIVEGPSLNVAGLGDSVVMQLASSNQGGTTLAEMIFAYVNNAQVGFPIVNITNLGMAIFSTLIPAAVAGRAGLWSSFGYLHYVSGADGNNYATGLLTAFANGQLVNSTSPATVAPFSFNVTQGIPYKVTGKVNYTGNQAAGTPSFRLLGPAGSVVQVGFHFFTVGGAGGVISSDWTAFNVNATGPTLAAGGGVDFEFSGHITPGATGALTLAALTSVNADTYNITANSSMDISPC